MDCFVSKILKDSKHKTMPRPELRQLVITSYSNTINKTNEGVKHSSYKRVLLNRTVNQLCRKLN